MSKGWILKSFYDYSRILLAGKDACKFAPTGLILRKRADLTNDGGLHTKRSIRECSTSVWMVRSRFLYCPPPCFHDTIFLFVTLNRFHLTFTPSREVIIPLDALYWSLFLARRNAISFHAWYIISQQRVSAGMIDSPSFSRIKGRCYESYCDKYSCFYSLYPFAGIVIDVAAVLDDGRSLRREYFDVRS